MLVASSAANDARNAVSSDAGCCGTSQTVTHTTGTSAGQGRNMPDGYRTGSDRIATAPEPSSRRLPSFESTYFDGPANDVGP